MGKILSIAFASFFVIALFSCHKDAFNEDLPLPQSELALPQGHWQWTETKGSVQMADASPQLAGFEVSMDIFDTLITVYKDGVEVASDSFKILLSDGTSCSPDELLEDEFLLQVSNDFNLAVSLATNAMLTIPVQSVVSYEENENGDLFMSLHETTCAGFTYIFRKIQ